MAHLVDDNRTVCTLRDVVAHPLRPRLLHCFTIVRVEGTELLFENVGQTHHRERRRRFVTNTGATLAQGFLFQVPELSAEVRIRATQWARHIKDRSREGKTSCADHFLHHRCNQLCLELTAMSVLCPGPDDRPSLRGGIEAGLHLKFLHRSNDRLLHIGRKLSILESLWVDTSKISDSGIDPFPVDSADNPTTRAG